MNKSESTAPTPFVQRASGRNSLTKLPEVPKLIMTNKPQSLRQVLLTQNPVGPAETQ